MNLSEYARDSLEFLVFPKLNNIEKTGKGQWIACCPNHSGNTQNLHIGYNPNNEEPLSLRCIRGCSLYSICEALVIDQYGLFPGRLGQFMDERTDWLERNPEALMAHYRDCLKAGVRLSTEDRNEYQELCLQVARRAA